MGIRAKILCFVGILVVVALAQMGASWWMSHSMGEKLSSGASEVVAAMGDSIKRNESDRVGATLLAGTSDLKAMVAEVERATMVTADFAYSVMAFAETSQTNTRLAEQEVDRFCTVMLTERMPFVSGIGLSFGLDGFSPYRRHYMPYAYREEGEVVFSDEVVAPEGMDPATMTDEEKDESITNEETEDYFVTAVPADHDRSRPLPQVISWTSPYTILPKTLRSSLRPLPPRLPPSARFRRRSRPMPMPPIPVTGSCARRPSMSVPAGVR